ncbi:hypothetical protein [Limosilactobacillus fermentum]|uniref:hypothetical protein n=1 Tax=Limosilactobacillus fermentum TaxID=1613 RepID=UPI002F26BB49
MTGEKPGTVGPDGYSLDIAHTTEPGYAERQADLIFDYQTNVALYPQFQDYVRQYQPEFLAAWGKNDPSFIYPGAPTSAARPCARPPLIPSCLITSALKRRPQI